MTTQSTLTASLHRPWYSPATDVSGPGRASPRNGPTSACPLPNGQAASMVETACFDVAAGTVSSRNIPTSALTSDTPPTISIG